MTHEWLVQRFVSFQNGTTVTMPISVHHEQTDAERHAKRLAEDEGSIATASLMVIEGTSASDTGFTAASFMAEVLGVVDFGFTVLKVEKPSSLWMVK